MVSVDKIKQQQSSANQSFGSDQRSFDRGIIPYVNQLIDRHNIKAVIFDVDGTLYSLKKLYDRMHWELFNITQRTLVKFSTSGYYTISSKPGNEMQRC
jgi:hypothetical protein